MIGKQPFGRTGHASTRTLFGAAALDRGTQAEAADTRGQASRAKGKIEVKVGICND